MSFITRARANSEADGGKQKYWVDQAFVKYSFPIDLGRDRIDPIHGHIVRMQSRYLGTASVKSGSFFYTSALFYEITESEISEVAFKAQNNSSGSSACSSDEVAVLDSEKSTMTLPPKKRKRRRVLRYDVIFCLLLNSDKSRHQNLLDSRQYYLFPREAIVASFTENPPFEVLVSFHLPKTSVVQENTATSGTKLEELAGVQGRHKRRLTDPGLQLPPILNQSASCHVINVRLSGVSKTLYTALKQAVSDFEKVYGKMMQLMELHSQQLSAQKLDFDIDNVDEEDIKFTNMITKKYMANWTSEDDDDDDDYVEPIKEPVIEVNKLETASTSLSNINATTKQCLYCGSKSTPMWRRGPQGAGTLCNACGVKWKHGKILCGQAPQQTIEKKKKRVNKKSKKEPSFVNNIYATAGVEAVEAATVLTLLKRS